MDTRTALMILVGLVDPYTYQTLLPGGVVQRYDDEDIIEYKGRVRKLVKEYCVDWLTMVINIGTITKR